MCVYIQCVYICLRVCVCVCMCVCVCVCEYVYIAPWHGLNSEMKGILLPACPVFLFSRLILFIVMLPDARAHY